MCDKNKTKGSGNDKPPYDPEDPNTILVNPIPPEDGMQMGFESAKIDATKSFVGTGMTELEPCKDKPKLEGEIIFCHGYQSSPGHNEEGTFWNAPTKQNPDEPGFFTKKGENADEYDHTSQDDIYTNEELNSDLPQNDRKKDAAIRKALENDGFMKFSDARQHWNYWNSISNKFAATEEYAKYFNATGREHYINGSHGMGSAANHRIDHGISLGYTWAQCQWHISDRATIEKNKENMPSCEGCSPVYKPVTVVGHSQGCATAVGVVLGIMRYALDLKWNEIPINIILLGVHQNYGFPDGTYNYEEDVLVQKGEKYEITNADFWDGYLKSPAFKEADKVKSMFNGLSHVFDVSNHRRGIDQHGEAITKKWSVIKGRAVQFTFCNDRGDTVFRDGDIKAMDCAGSPKPDTSFLSVEFFKNGDPVEPQSSNYEEVTITPAQSGGYGGTLTIPCYAINKRLIFKDITELKDDESWKDHQTHKPEWTNYRTLAIEWAEAFDRFKYLKQQYEQKLTQWREQVMKRAKEQRYAPRPRLSTDVIKAQIGLKEARCEMIYTYGRIHEADLYAHFSPVSLISDGKALSDWGGARTPGDSVGTTGSIWKRLQAVKEKRFYRVPHNAQDPKSKPEKRETEKNYVEGRGKEFLIPTIIVETDHITKIVDEHVLNPDPKSIWEQIKEWRYKKDWWD